VHRALYRLSHLHEAGERRPDVRVPVGVLCQEVFVALGHEYYYCRLKLRKELVAAF
jgi:hypothetical protein